MPVGHFTGGCCYQDLQRCCCRGGRCGSPVLGSIHPGPPQGSTVSPHAKWRSRLRWVDPETIREEHRVMRALVERNAAAGKGKRSRLSAVVVLADSCWFHHMQRCSVCSLPTCWSLSNLRRGAIPHSCRDHVSSGRHYLWSRSGAHFLDMTLMPCGCHVVSFVDNLLVCSKNL